MALVNVPQIIIGGKMSGASSTTLLNATDERVGHCGYFTTPDGATRSVTHICWATGTVTTGDDILCQIETIDAATGLPNGIVSAGRSGTQTVADGNDNAYFETALSTPYTITSGTFLACTFKMTTSGKSLNIVKGAVYGAATPNASWVAEDITGGGVYVIGTYPTNVALKCSTGEYLIPLGGTIAEVYTSQAISEGGTPRYAGNRIQVPINAKIVGVFSNVIDMDAALTISLRDSTGAILLGDDGSTNMAMAIAAPYRSSTSGAVTVLYFPCPKTLIAGTDYYLVGDAASAINLRKQTYETEELKNQDNGVPTGWVLNGFTATTVWDASDHITESALSIIGLLPVISHMDFGPYSQLGVSTATTGAITKEAGANARGGSGNCIKFNPASTTVNLTYAFLVPVTAATEFTLALYHKITSSYNGTVKVTIYDSDDDATVLLNAETVTLTDDASYHQYVSTGCTPTDTGFCRVKIDVLDGSTTGDVYIDDITVQAV